MNIFTDVNICQEMTYPVGSNIDELNEYLFVYEHHIKQLFPTGLDKPILNFACRGSSGAIIAGILSSKLQDNYNCNIVYIKKPKEQSHWNILSLRLPGYIIIVDDFLDTGRTVSEIYKKLKESFKYEPKIDLLMVSGEVHDYHCITFCHKLDNLVCGRVGQEFRLKYQTNKEQVDVSLSDVKSLY